MIMSRQATVGIAMSIGLLTACRSQPALAPVPSAAALAAGQRLRDSVAAANAAVQQALNQRATGGDRPGAPGTQSASGSTPGEPAPGMRSTMPTSGRSPEEERRLADAARATMAERIYFAYDQDAISDDQHGVLDAKIPILLANPRVRIRVGGHTDERGSDEYNVALGQRRAATVKRYLVARGVDEGRIDVVSFGRERPLVAGVDEDTWARNRRGEFEIIAGGESLRAPR